VIKGIKGIRVQGVDTCTLYSKPLSGGEDQGHDAQLAWPMTINPKLPNQVRERIKAKTHNTQKKALRKKVTDYW
jgi:hypothetical protein